MRRSIPMTPPKRKMTMNEAFIDDEQLKVLIRKANTLMEALPHIQRFRDKTIVVKYGGHAMIDPTLKQSVMNDIVLMEHIGINPVIVHGGGPEITSLMDRVGLESEFVDGHRVTDAKALEVAEMVLVGKLRGEIVSRIQNIGGRAVGLSGKDGQTLVARKKPVDKGQDMGYVGEVEKVHTGLIELLESRDFIPVISPIADDEDGQTYNINADTVAAEIAKALKCEKLILMTDVRGVCRDASDPSTLIQRIACDDVEKMVEEEVVRGGMIPKVRACRDAIKAGCHVAHIIDGRMPHALLIELFTDSGVGTMIES